MLDLDQPKVMPKEARFMKSILKISCLVLALTGCGRPHEGSGDAELKQNAPNNLLY